MLDGGGNFPFEKKFAFETGFTLLKLLLDGKVAFETGGILARRWRSDAGCNDFAFEVGAKYMWRVLERTPEKSRASSQKA